jgi:hypothetical protein
MVVNTSTNFILLKPGWQVKGTVLVAGYDFEHSILHVDLREKNGFLENFWL